MKRFVGYCLTWTFYFFGEVLSHPMCWLNMFSFLYPLYNWLMNQSAAWQHWAGLNQPWCKPMYRAEADEIDEMDALALLAEANAIIEKHSHKQE